MQYFNIQVASQLSGVASSTIRAWEKRYSAVEPERADNKHRLYSKDDIEKLALLYQLTELGQSIGKIARLDLEELKSVYSSLMHRPFDEMLLMTPRHEKINCAEIIQNICLALSAYKLDIVSHELEKAKSVLTPKELCLNILNPLFQELEKSNMTLSQVRLLKTTINFHVGQMMTRSYEQGFIKNEVILLATPSNEFGMEILGPALLCMHYGVGFIFLGTNVTAACLAEAAASLKCKNILLGSSPTDEAGLEECLKELSIEFNVKAEIWVNGSNSLEFKSRLESRRVRNFTSLDDLVIFFETINHTYRPSHIPS